jgi:2-(1,2-epoxy-1,2-dihydrophenyl)acetyl-CoA isomerase
MPMSYETIQAETKGGVCRIAFNRPDKLNPLSATLLRETAAAFTEAAADDAVRAIVLTGNGRAFSAGADLREAGLTQDLGAALEDRYNPLVTAIRTAPKPVLAAINGICAGAACNIALACDIVVATRSAVFIEVFARIGLMPDAGGTWFLPRAVGTPRAIAAAMLADDIPADRAADWGLIWDAIDDEFFWLRVDALAERLASGPTRAYAAIKRAIYTAEGPGLAAQLALEAELQRDLGRSADLREGVASFLEKRKAVFTGR